MRSRLLLGVGAWVLGATMATIGSLYAVGQLGNSLFAVPSKPLSARMVNAELRSESARAEPEPTTSTPDHRRTVHHSGLHKLHRASPSHSASPSPTPTPTNSSAPAGVLLSSADGSAKAVCEAGGAYLLYWSPAPGYEADNVSRGPAAVAYVAFTNNYDTGIIMKVTCQGGVPVKHLSKAVDH